MDKLDKADRAGTPRTVAGTLGTVGSAFVALFMLGAITFGATVIRPMTANPAPEDQTEDQSAKADRADRAGHGGQGGAEGGPVVPGIFDAAKRHRLLVAFTAGQQHITGASQADAQA